MCVLSIATENMNAVISASAALIGVLVGQAGNWLLSLQKDKQERKVLLRSKYEELAFLLVDSVGDYQKILTAESTHQLLRDSQPVSAQKVLSLAQLYFQELSHPAAVYLAALVSFRNACARAAVAKPDASWVEAIATSPQVDQAQSALEEAKKVLEKNLEAYAKIYTLA